MIKIHKPGACLRPIIFLTVYQITQSFTVHYHTYQTTMTLTLKMNSDKFCTKLTVASWLYDECIFTDVPIKEILDIILKSVYKHSSLLPL